MAAIISNLIKGIIYCLTIHNEECFPGQQFNMSKVESDPHMRMYFQSQHFLITQHNMLQKHNSKTFQHDVKNKFVKMLYAYMHHNTTNI